MLILAFSALLTGCDSSSSVDDTSGGDTSGDTSGGGPPVLELSFQMDADFIPSMEEPPVGSFRGSIYAEADASAVGPVDGAEPLLDFSVDGIDLSDGGGPTGVLWTTDTLAAQVVWVLGCLDSDGNDCDTHDPITVPNENKFAIAESGTTSFTVYMGMLNPT
jgi:hypothetical protein